MVTAYRQKQSGNMQRGDEIRARNTNTVEAIISMKLGGMEHMIIVETELNLKVHQMSDESNQTNLEYMT